LALIVGVGMIKKDFKNINGDTHKSNCQDLLQSSSKMKHLYPIGRKFGHYKSLKKKMGSYGSCFTRLLLLTHEGLRLTNSFILFALVMTYTLRKLFHTFFFIKNVIMQDMCGLGL
jgi:hypothetical protein